MSNKNLNQFSLLTDVASGDFLLIWDASAGLTYKAYISDVVATATSNPSSANNWFDDLYVRHWLFASGIMAGDTGSQMLRSKFGGILAGARNTVSGSGSAIVGGERNIITLTATNSTILGGVSNQITERRALIGGGDSDLVSRIGGAIVSATNSTNGGYHATIVNGDTNLITGGTATSNFSLIGGGINQSIYLPFSLIGDGELNTIYQSVNNVGYSSIVGGKTNQTNADYAFIGGGSGNKVSGNLGVVLGGSSGVASGEYSAVFGQRCEATQNGAVIFGDSTSTTKRSYGPDSFTLNFSGGAWVTGGGLNARRGFNLYPTGDAPTSSTPGRSGDFAYKDNFLYVFTGDQADLSNKNWGRIQLSTLDNSPPSVVSNDSSIIHTRGANYALTDAFAAVTFTNGVNPAITIPAGNNTYLIDCVFGACKGSTTAITIDYFLYNTDDSRMIPGTSGNYSLVAAFGTPPTQFVTRAITGTNYGAAKNVQLYAKTTLAGDNALIHSTGTYISYIKLA